jgi:phage protein D/phage baseplate assembly protein gpV
VTEPFYAPRFEIRIAGLTLAADVTDQVMSLHVETDLDLAGSFSLMLRNAENALLDSALLDLGKTVEIHLGYGTELEPAFLGEIAAIEPSFPPNGPPTIRVVGYDKSYRMRRAQPPPTEYRFMNDSLIAARIAVQNGLIPIVDPTPGVLTSVPQLESDMAFLKARAQRYFFDVYVEWDRLHFQFPRPQAAAHVLEWGRNLSSLAPRISAAGLAGLQVIRGYNQELAQSIYAAALAADFDPDDIVERLGSAAMDLLTSLARKGIRKESVDNPLDAAVIAKSLLADLLEGMYEGQGSCIGMPDLTAGSYVEIRGVGKRFGGTYRLRKVTHRIDDAGFSTDFSITQRSQSSLLGLLRKQVVEQPSPHKQERLEGLVVGVVEDNSESTAVPPVVPIGRVKVSFPGLADTFTSRWAPCARPMAGADMGFYALPEVGEQVLVAFEHGDPTQPYVLGSLWSDKMQPPVRDLDGTNSKRVIKSRAGHSITFDDSRSTEKLLIEDALGSAITLDARDGSITIDARGDLTIAANGDLTIAANGVVTLEAAGGTRKISMTPANVDVV